MNLITITGPPKKGRRKEKLYPCSDGKNRNTTQLASTAEISQPAMSLRLKDNGWKNKDILNPNKHKDRIMQPTRIIRKPYKLMIGAYYYFHLDCNDGKTYLVSELAHMKNMSNARLMRRINELGWDHPDVLKDDKLKKEEEMFQDSPYKTIIPGDLAHLGSTHNTKGERVYI